ncbi:SGNH/GDSL hydrolase family protein [Umezawaea tangerina]|uniref:GDSL-like lipase/acylhydrolase family protein n=1 Tax=Umezawaea tangerina TaxID=84725 RepID=A0A2T0SL24_9PSEU|nr:SGNH/GDSL hydrolase family protein [Umezawaea tangerina]PRY34106.1 GDSL-like lipase/acylhydrolase family protein [Umezawaea tangerina]
MRRLLPVLLAALSITATTGTASAAPRYTEYVALGDSAAAGPLIPNQDVLHLGCLRSTRNWPSVLASTLGVAEFRDVTCSGAVADDFEGGQTTFLGAVPPQFDALTPTTDLVTLTIGGNDIGLVGAALGCVNLLPEPVGLSCEDRLTAGGTDQLAVKIDAFADEFGAVLDGVHARAPRADVVVVGYGTYIRPGGCYPVQPLWGRDSDYLQASIDRLNALFADQAAAHGARFVDIAPPSVGHDVCAPVSRRWFEGLVPTTVAAPLHPNQRGMAGIGAYIADSLPASAS